MEEGWPPLRARAAAVTSPGFSTDGYVGDATADPLGHIARGRILSHRLRHPSPHRGKGGPASAAARDSGVRRHTRSMLRQTQITVRLAPRGGARA
jgi:hypothetical protein